MHGLSAEQWTAIFTAGLFGTGVFALLYARWQIRESHNQAQIQHLMSFVKDFDGESMTNCRRLYAQNRLRGVESSVEQDRILDFFETIGLLVKRGYLDATDVWELFANDLICFYEDARSRVEEDRKEDPPAYSNFIKIAEQLKNIERKNHGAYANPTHDDIKEYLEYWKDTETTAPPKTIRLRGRKPSRFLFPRSS